MDGSQSSGVTQRVGFRCHQGLFTHALDVLKWSSRVLGIHQASFGGSVVEAKRIIPGLWAVTVYHSYNPELNSPVGFDHTFHAQLATVV